METFIYYCVNENGVKMSFFSRAVLDTGLTVFDYDGSPFTIVDMEIQRPISVIEDAIDRALARI